jgi:hypothetical protein
MKTIEQIKREINLVASSQPAKKPSMKDSLKEWNRAQKRVVWLRECILYLETIPNKQFLIDQRDKKRHALKAIDEGFEKWCMNTPGMLKLTSAKSLYNKEMGRSKIIKHLDTLDFILS